MIRPLLALAAIALAGCGGPSGVDQPAAGNRTAAAEAIPVAAPRRPDPPVPRHLPAIVRIRIETEAGTIVVALDHGRAPVTTANFVRYADDHRFDGTYFYRSARNRFAPDQGFIQGG